MWDKSKILYYWLAIITLAYAFFMVGLNRIPVPTVDGAIRASEARHIIETGQLWPPVLEGKLVTDHPPLYLWLSALSFKVFGITDFAANLPAHICAFLTVIFTALIVVEAGFGLSVALLSALVLCLTRDFILSSVRGFIEPLLECFTYAGFWLCLGQKRKNRSYAAFGAGVMVWLAAFSKGPVALLPFIFFPLLLILQARSFRKRVIWVMSYLIGFGLCTLIWAIWVERNDHWHYWHSYLFGQILSSAIEGRGGAQTFEPFYFLNILTKFYWPWLPLLILSILRLGFWVSRKRFHQQCIYSSIFFLFGLGFVLGFSLMRWKFWYYIAPAYPAFALFIVVSLYDFIKVRINNVIFAHAILGFSLIWIIAASLFPIQLHRERVPEVLAFKETIKNSPIHRPVWFVQNPMDHNMIATSGFWYFNRVVKKVANEQEWETHQLDSPSWIITGSEFFKTCKSNWCTKSKLIQSAGKSALLYFGR